LNQIFDEIRSEGYDVNLRGIVLCLPEKHYKQCIIKSEAGANLIKSGLDQCGLNLCSTSIGKTPQHKLTIVFGSIEGLMKKSRNLDLYAEKHQGSVFHLIAKTAVTQT
jgi:hypothetical protein